MNEADLIAKGFVHCPEKGWHKPVRPLTTPLPESLSLTRSRPGVLTGQDFKRQLASEKELGRSIRAKTKLVVASTTDEQKLNKLEREWLAEMRHRKYGPIHVQSITFKLADDTRYTPDFAAVVAGKLIAFETKGPQFWDDAKVKLKVAARLFPEINFVLVTRDKAGNWKETAVKP